MSLMSCCLGIYSCTCCTFTSSFTHLFLCVYVLISFHSFRSWSGLLFTFSNVCVCECGEDATSRSSYIKCTPTFMWVKIRIHRLKSDSFPSLEKCSFNSALRLLHFAKFNHYLNRFVLHFIFGRYIFS